MLIRLCQTCRFPFDAAIFKSCDTCVDLYIDRHRDDLKLTNPQDSPIVESIVGAKEIVRSSITKRTLFPCAACGKPTPLLHPQLCYKCFIKYHEK